MEFAVYLNTLRQPNKSTNFFESVFSSLYIYIFLIHIYIFSLGFVYSLALEIKIGGMSSFKMRMSMRPRACCHNSAILTLFWQLEMNKNNNNNNKQPLQSKYRNNIVNQKILTLVKTNHLHYMLCLYFNFYEQRKKIVMNAFSMLKIFSLIIYLMLLKITFK